MEEERELPVGWVMAPLGDLASFEMGQAPPGSACNFSGEGEIFVKAGEFGPRHPVVREWTTQPLKFATHRDVLICVVGATAGKLNLGIDCAIGRSVAAIRPSEQVDQLALYFQLLLSVLSLRGSSTGSAQAVISKKTLGNTSIALAPLNEQRRIAAKLDTSLAALDACRQRLDGVEALLKRFRQAVLAAATSGKLTREWREENADKTDASSLVNYLQNSHQLAGGHKAGNAAPPTTGVHDLDEQDLPAEWALVCLRDIVRPERPITYGILKPGPELPDGIPYVRVADYPGDRLNTDSIRKTSCEIDEAYKRSRLQSGDLLLSIRGTVGRLISIPKELEGANITQDSARVSVQAMVETSYVEVALRSEIVQSRMRRAVKGVAVRGINIGDVRALQIPLPSVEEQEEISRRVSVLFSLADQLEARLSAARKIVDRLTPALLAKAFRGELVPQEDPNDEPASVLLERIRAARQAEAAAAGPSRRGRRKAAASPVPGPVAAAPVTPDLLTTLLRECGALSERALLAASELDPASFQAQLAHERGLGTIRATHDDGQELLEAAG